ncbi:ATP-dependent DNA helicase Snf21 [Coemansia spiralis]|uniref:ATP-dependent DNA helicase Snf21 n=2 Tax=Coemansia TaxID=4863 RepID=A0A9W8G218_9FUNG|nr:ATP-dependent DNA helicase Snf21 [Coemansia umbellata]KAJ2618549.1 ATP-dependent DNA helicase Snf21 [Coemansia sp. RSA 1358]KAJ2668325.1 ATP-dependent DNA helicase Snf21 [Coemansia spiralis]
MQIQTSPSAAIPAAPQDGSVAAGSMGTVLTREKLQQIVLAAQTMRARGATEETNEEYAKLMRIMRYVTAQQQQQQQQQVSPKQQQTQPSAANGVINTDAGLHPATPAAASPTHKDANSNHVASDELPGTPDTDVDTGPGSGAVQTAHVSTPKPATAEASSTVAVVPELFKPQSQQPQIQSQSQSQPAVISATAKPPQFSPDDVAQLRKQIQAFRLVSKNIPLPPQLRQDLWASSIPDEEKRLLDSPPSALNTAAGNIVEAVHSTIQNNTTSSRATATPTQPSASSGDKSAVQLALPPLPRRIDFVSPHALLKDKLTAAGDQPARLQRLLVPSITPNGLDVRAMEQERERRREARIEYRIKELAELPAGISDENLDVGIMHDQKKYLRPGLVQNASSSARLKALIELKALGLRHKQRALRTEVVRSITRASQLGVAGDRTALRRMKKQSQREARLTEKMERQQRQERERREQDQHKQQLQAVTSHGASLVMWHKAQQQHMSKLGRAVLAFHAHAEREEQKRKERVARERIQALKAGDEEAYLKLVDKEKDTRISHLLSQTDQYLNTLIDAVHRQQQSVGTSETTGDNEDAPSWLADNVEMDEEEAAAAKSRDYYTVAHFVREKVSRQPDILVGGTLKEYQLHGLEWMVSLYNNHLNGILADEMGLGKTIQTISLITYLIEKKQQNGPFLIIVPLSTITNWLLEFEKWAPSVKVIGYKGNPMQRQVLQQQIRRHDFQVVLTTFQYVIKDRPVLAKVNWIHMIIDEGHRMKSKDSKLALTLSTFYKTRYRLILTGTPLQNNLPELWALLNFILPRIFSSAQDFDEWFNAPFASAGGQDRIELNEEETLLVIKRLHKVLRPFLLRRLKKDVEVDLPDKVEHVVKCGMSAVQSRLYHQMLKFGTLFRGVRSEEGGGRSRISGLNNTIVQLRKICNHPFVYEEVESRINPSSVNSSLLYRVSGKFELLDRMLEKLLATNHKVLIFFQMTKIMDIVQDFLAWRGIPSLRLDGSTADAERREYMRVFNEPDSPYSVFMLSTRAGGQGLNLQTADTVIIFESDWNPSMDAQAMDRAHRIGQKNEVRILRLITRGTVEETVLARAEFKRDMDGKVIQAGKFDNKTSAEERDQLLRSLLKAEEAAEEDAAEGEDTANSDEELNDMMARGDEERVIFARMDKERAERERREWLDAGNTGNPPERLFTESELPEEYLHDYDPVEERRKIEEEATRDKSRNRQRVYYDDGLSEEQWLDALENDGVDMDEVIRKKRERQERRVKRREQKLLEQHLRSKLEGADTDNIEYDDDDDEADGDNEDITANDSGDSVRVRSASAGGGAAATAVPGAAQATPRKRGRPRRSASSTASSLAQTPSASGGTTAAAMMATPGENADRVPATPATSGDSGAVESGMATPGAGGRRTGRKRLRLAGIDHEEDTGAGAGTGAATPTGASARKSRRKTGAADLLPPEERARLDEIFEAAFAAVEACVSSEYGHRCCDLFLELPSKRDYPDYYVIIRQPIAMKTIRRNVKAHRYGTVRDFHSDWLLMFNNARTYNEEGSVVYEDACDMQRALENKLNEMTGEDYRTPIGTQSPLPPAFNLTLPQNNAVPAAAGDMQMSAVSGDAILNNKPAIDGSASPSSHAPQQYQQGYSQSPSPLDRTHSPTVNGGYADQDANNCHQ